MIDTQFTNCSCQDRHLFCLSNTIEDLSSWLENLDLSHIQLAHYGRFCEMDGLGADVTLLYSPR